MTVSSESKGSKLKDRVHNISAIAAMIAISVFAFVAISVTVIEILKIPALIKWIVS